MKDISLTVKLKNLMKKDLDMYTTFWRKFFLFSSSKLETCYFVTLELFQV